MDQAKKHQILYTEIRRVPQGQRIFFGELISGGGDQPPWPSWTEGMLAPYDCIVYERSESLLDQRAEAGTTHVECEPKLAAWEYRKVGYLFAGTSLSGDPTFEISSPGDQYWVAHALREDHARLIVTACNSYYEMLDALKAADAALENAYGILGPQTPSSLVADDMRKVKAAIAKATRAGGTAE